MMKTPICDFVDNYIKNSPSRMHMPGHKGKGYLSVERLDITEISGADSLFEAEGIIGESEMNASSLFGANSFYSTEGSSLSIRGMVYLFRLWAGEDGVIIAGRNAHKAFLSAVALNDVEVEWISSNGISLLECPIDCAVLENLLLKHAGRKIGVYITSPDYLGNCADLKAISALCKKHGAKLLVDNAHGAYSKFLKESRHPIDLGADMCCDSAHKTLPVLTGGGYLHISKDNAYFSQKAKDALALFASTSPSYLILQSLDRANLYLSQGYKEKLELFSESVSLLKKRISEMGFELLGSEPLKIVIAAKKFGYYGFDLAKLLESKGIFAEFADRDNLVLMLTPENDISDLEKLFDALGSVSKKHAIEENQPKIGLPQRALTPRQAIFAETEIINVKDGLGRIFGGFNISCPPAVPIILCGEVIDQSALDAFDYYGVERICVIK